MITIQLSVHDWLQLPVEVRIKLKEIFGIPKSEGTLIEGNVVKSDGHTYKDLSAITLEKLQKFLHRDDEDFAVLINAAIDKVKADLEAEKEAVINEGPDPKQLLLDEWAAILNRMRGQAAEHQMEDYLNNIIKRLFNVQQNAEPKLPIANEGNKGKKTKKQRR